MSESIRKLKRSSTLRNKWRGIYERNESNRACRFFFLCNMVPCFWVQTRNVRYQQTVPVWLRGRVPDNSHLQFCCVNSVCHRDRRKVTAVKANQTLRQMWSKIEILYIIGQSRIIYIPNTSRLWYWPFQPLILWFWLVLNLFYNL